jgi:hypothetical protein
MSLRTAAAMRGQTDPSYGAGRRRPMRQQCATCPTVVRRATSILLCPACLATAETVFRRSHSPLDADWIRARNRFFGDRDVLLAVVRGELAATAAAA